MKRFVFNVLKGMEQIDNQESKICDDCDVLKDMSEFRIVDGKERRNNICRDCEAERRGVKKPGMNRFSKRLEARGFLICSFCQEVLPKECFGKNKARKNGLSNICKECRKSIRKLKKLNIDAK